MMKHIKNLKRAMIHPEMNKMLNSNTGNYSVKSLIDESINEGGSTYSPKK